MWKRITGTGKRSNGFWNYLHTERIHIFQKAEVTLNKIEKVNWHYFLGEDFRCNVYGVVHFPGITFWMVEILPLPMKRFYWSVLKANTTLHKTNTKKGHEKLNQVMVFFLRSILLQVTWALERILGGEAVTSASVVCRYFADGNNKNKRRHWQQRNWDDVSLLANLQKPWPYFFPILLCLLCAMAGWCTARNTSLKIMDVRALQSVCLIPRSGPWFCFGKYFSHDCNT